VKKTAVLAWVVLLPIVLFSVTPAVAQPLLDPTTLTKYVDPLPQPPVRQPVGRYNGRPLYEVHIKAATQQMHRDLGPTNVFTFDGITPGPTFVATYSQPIAVRYINELPDSHMFHVDTMIDVMMGTGWNQSSRFVSHLHGAADIEASSDGWCMDFIYPGQETVFKYPNTQPGATLWYHDHSCGITRLNAYAGLAGFYLITDPREKRLNLPAGPYELGIAAQDRVFTEDGQLYYPSEWVPEFFGDVSLVNGKIWPMQDVEPRKYRIRFLNGCDDRFLSMKLIESTHEGYIAPDSAPGPAIYMIGTEQGLVNNTYKFNDPNVTNSPRLLVGPGDRRDLIIDFTGQQGKCFIVTNNAPAPFDGTYDGFGGPDDTPLPELFMFCVKDTQVVDNSTIPMHPGNVPTYNPAQSCFTRDIFLHEMEDMMGNPMMVMLNDMHFMAPITDFPTYNCTEVWRFINTTVDEHPMHTHLVNAQIINRQKFDVDRFLLDHTLVLLDQPVPPDPWEEGNHDMYNCPPGMVTSIITSKFNMLGKYVYHCHILAHEENDMMRPYQVVLPNQTPGGGMMAAGLEPVEPALSVSGPEPFRGRASIAYSAGIEQHVKLSVYNSLGQEVKSLVHGAVNRGLHSTVWDGTDNTGSQVASGTYFYKLETPRNSQTVRATLVR